jgi:hypothetical protein
MIEGKNPCDVCEAKNKASGCDNCVLNIIISHGECQNDKCFCNYECGCLLSLDDTCKASTCYQDDYIDHDCGECEKFTVKYYEDGCEYYTCGEDEAQIGEYDSACESFKEREG